VTGDAELSYDENVERSAEHHRDLEGDRYAAARQREDADVISMTERGKTRSEHLTCFPAIPEGDLHHGTSRFQPSGREKGRLPGTNSSAPVVAGMTTLARTIRGAAHPLRGDERDFDPLLERCAEARLVLLGEATHGTHDFYRARAEITRRLVEEHGFHAVALEGDWPSTYRVNRFVRGSGDAAIDALADFRRFPRWMWRNADVLDFIGWLRDHNDGLTDGSPQVGVYGLDLYSLSASIDEVITFLERIDPAAAERARHRYDCFGDVAENPHHYGRAATLGLTRSCEDQVVAQLVEMQRRAAELMKADGFAVEDEAFCAEQNARVAQNAERYYRAMFSGRISSWNVRDEHMTDTLDRLSDHVARSTADGRSKIVVWAHNSHLGDARATELGQAGEVNVGSLTRERHGTETTLLVGFSTFTGTVSAASDWDGPVERKRVIPARSDSYERLMHDTESPAFLLDLRASRAAAEALREPRLERAIGVIYRPETERESHYFAARLADQFDVLLHYDVTRAVEPFDRCPEWKGAASAETYPSGF
jgi:erythromycin esterase-like protein